MQLSQINLISAISTEIEKQIPGIPAEPRYMNAIIKAATLVCDVFEGVIIEVPNNRFIDIRLTREEAAKEVGVSPQTLANWASNGRVNIPYHKIGKRKVFYYKSDIDAYIASTRTVHMGD
ncbi:hypothetical protein MASR2M36_17790 [Providencia sp.]